MLLIAFLALASAAYVQRMKELWSREYVITYDVGDLVKPSNPDIRPIQLDSLAEKLRRESPPDEWSKSGRTVTPFFSSNGLIIRSSLKGHEAVKEFLEKLRSSKNF